MSEQAQIVYDKIITTGPTNGVNSIPLKASGANNSGNYIVELCYYIDNNYFFKWYYHIKRKGKARFLTTQNIILPKLYNPYSYTGNYEGWPRSYNNPQGFQKEQSDLYIVPGGENQGITSWTFQSNAPNDIGSLPGFAIPGNDLTREFNVILTPQNSSIMANSGTYSYGPGNMTGTFKFIVKTNIKPAEIDPTDWKKEDNKYTFYTDCNIMFNVKKAENSDDCNMYGYAILNIDNYKQIKSDQWVMSRGEQSAVVNFSITFADLGGVISRSYTITVYSYCDVNKEYKTLLGTNSISGMIKKGTGTISSSKQVAVKLNDVTVTNYYSDAANSYVFTKSDDDKRSQLSYNLLVTTTDSIPNDEVLTLNYELYQKIKPNGQSEKFVLVSSGSKNPIIKNAINQITHNIVDGSSGTINSNLYLNGVRKEGADTIDIDYYTNNFKVKISIYKSTGNQLINSYTFDLNPIFSPNNSYYTSNNIPLDNPPSGRNYFSYKFKTTNSASSATEFKTCNAIRRANTEEGGDGIVLTIGMTNPYTFNQISNGLGEDNIPTAKNPVGDNKGLDSLITHGYKLNIYYKEGLAGDNISTNGFTLIESLYWTEKTHDNKVKGVFKTRSLTSENGIYCSDVTDASTTAFTDQYIGQSFLAFDIKPIPSSILGMIQLYIGSDLTKTVEIEDDKAYTFQVEFVDAFGYKISTIVDCPAFLESIIDFDDVAGACNINIPVNARAGINGTINGSNIDFKREWSKNYYTFYRSLPGTDNQSFYRRDVPRTRGEACALQGACRFTRGGEDYYAICLIGIQAVDSNNNTNIKDSSLYVYRVSDHKLVAWAQNAINGHCNDICYYKDSLYIALLKSYTGNGEKRTETPLNTIYKYSFSSPENSSLSSPQNGKTPGNGETTSSSPKYYGLNNNPTKYEFRGGVNHKTPSQICTDGKNLFVGADSALQKVVEATGTDNNNNPISILKPPDDENQQELIDFTHFGGPHGPTIPGTGQGADINDKFAFTVRYNPNIIIRYNRRSGVVDNIYEIPSKLENGSYTTGEPESLTVDNKGNCYLFTNYNSTPAWTASVNITQVFHQNLYTNNVITNNGLYDYREGETKSVYCYLFQKQGSINADGTLNRPFQSLTDALNFCNNNSNKQRFFIKILNSSTTQDGYDYIEHPAIVGFNGIIEGEYSSPKIGNLVIKGSQVVLSNLEITNITTHADDSGVQRIIDCQDSIVTLRNNVKITNSLNNTTICRIYCQNSEVKDFSTYSMQNIKNDSLGIHNNCGNYVGNNLLWAADGNYNNSDLSSSEIGAVLWGEKSKTSKTYSDELYEEQTIKTGTGAFNYYYYKQLINLEQKISEQPHGIVLVFQHQDDWGYYTFFIPKDQVVKAKNKGYSYICSAVGTRGISSGTIVNNPSGFYIVSKLVYIYDDKILGAAGNTATNDPFNNGYFLLKYVYGV